MPPLTHVRAAVDRFVAWLERYGEASHDHQSFFAGRLGRRAKALYYRRPRLGLLAVSPMVLCEAFAPSARRFFSPPLRFAIADAHFAMGFSMLSRAQEHGPYYRRAVHFLDVLERTRCPGFEAAWGYPFDWTTRLGVIPAGTPLITSVPYVYEAFREVYSLDKDERWREIMRSIADHALVDYRDVSTSPGAATCGYTPFSTTLTGVINASAYRAALLMTAARDFGDVRYHDAATRNAAFVLAAQDADGSWHYATDGERDFVDHFHTCFVLKALARLESLTQDARYTDAIERGIRYYVGHLFDAAGLPKPFSKPPRLTVYRSELYDYAECINLGTLLRGRFRELDDVWSRTVHDLLARWQKPDGSFRSRRLLLGWDNVPMHRWAQAQVFRSLSSLLLSLS
jgi:hypothetical protein